MRAQRTADEIAFIMGVAHRTACKLIDEGLITGFRLPAALGCRLLDRRVHHGAPLVFINKNNAYTYMLDKLIGIEPVATTPESVSTEVPPCKKIRKPKAKVE